MQKIALLASALILGFATPAEAQYLDPGAGSVMIQALIAGAVGAATVIKLYWSKISGLFRKRDRAGR